MKTVTNHSEQRPPTGHFVRGQRGTCHRLTPAVALTTSYLQRRYLNHHHCNADENKDEEERLRGIYTTSPGWGTIHRLMGDHVCPTMHVHEQSVSKEAAVRGGRGSPTGEPKDWLNDSQKALKEPVQALDDNHSRTTTTTTTTRSHHSSKTKKPRKRRKQEHKGEQR